MKRLLTISLLLAALATALVVVAPAGSAKTPPRPPKGFFGIGPQTELSPEDYDYMKAGGVGSIRIVVPWGALQPQPGGPYEFAALDEVVAEASRRGMRVLPILYGVPLWINKDERRLPIDNARQRSGWTKFLRALVERYGPGGEFFSERAPGVVDYQTEAVPRPQPIRSWQIWNEVNFFYFARPVSVPRYARLLSISSPVIKAVDPGAEIVLSGLFGEPRGSRARGIDATEFLSALYRYPGIKSRFDSVALHPYAIDTEDFERMVEEIHEVAVENHDRPGLQITELGWGSQNNFQEVAFEQGIQGQVKQLRGSYKYMLENRGRLNLKAAYWFSWKDVKDSCTFCDSVGLFREGKRFKPKPAWRAFVALSGGRARP
ncbi:MAG TPA: beta-galactosidase [Solirubrobacterales bacterium]|nr:beta-galactosidase [Solirubrobacterales bacterium]